MSWTQAVFHGAPRCRGDTASDTMLSAELRYHQDEAQMLSASSCSSQPLTKINECLHKGADVCHRHQQGAPQDRLDMHDRTAE